MKNEFDQEAEWQQAGIILVAAMKIEMAQGSLGIQTYMDRIRPLWHRYQAGERSDGLLEKIQLLQNSTEKN
jgi:hypothetical protein